MLFQTRLEEIAGLAVVHRESAALEILSDPLLLAGGFDLRAGRDLAVDSHGNTVSPGLAAKEADLLDFVKAIDPQILVRPPRIPAGESAELLPISGPGLRGPLDPGRVPDDELVDAEVVEPQDVLE